MTISTLALALLVGCHDESSRPGRRCPTLQATVVPGLAQHVTVDSVTGDLRSLP